MRTISLFKVKPGAHARAATARRQTLLFGLLLIVHATSMTTACQDSPSDGNSLTPVGSGERPEGADADANDLFLAAVRQGDLAKVRSSLASGEASIKARDGLGSSALLLAVRKTEQMPLVRFLYTADPGALNAGDGRERTPLSWAAHFDRAAIAKYLLEQGALVEQADRAGNTPLAYAAMRDSKATAKLLLQKGAAVNHRNNLCDTPLMFAAAKGHVEMTRLLTQNGADPGYEDQEGRTVHDRLGHLDADKRARIEAILKDAPRPATRPACEN
ncbi:MAG: ankyrin repeat domain-containing protein [Leptospirales bacterium]|jgi:ankyrin repeat protein